LLLGYGGTQAIAGLSGYSETAHGLLRDIGIQTERFHGFFDQQAWVSPNAGEPPSHIFITSQMETLRLRDFWFVL